MVEAAQTAAQGHADGQGRARPWTTSSSRSCRTWNRATCIIDGGNSHFPDTIRRTKYLEGKGMLYIGTGVSGGEEGARYGPSMMPGGSPSRVAAGEGDLPGDLRQDARRASPCCDWMGEDGAGHYVKMVHNGIEYGDMQLICEAYQLMKDGLGMSNEEMHARLRRVEQGRARQLPDRDHARHPRRTRTRTASTSWTRSSTPPARRARASGPASARSTWACRSR